MASKLYYNAFVPAFSNTGVAISGAKLYFYLTGTATPANIYSDGTLTTPMANPVVADLSGKYADIYLDSTIIYRVVQTDSVGGAIGDAVDPYIPGQALKGDPGSAGEGYPTISALAAVAATNLDDAYLTTAVREGKFVFSTADLSTEVTADTLQGRYIAPSSDVTGASGAWIRQYDGQVNVKWFDARGDGATDDTISMQAAHATGEVIFYPAGRYKFTTLSMVTGGIVGEGKATILDSTDTTTANLITHTTGDATGLLVNEQGAVFRDFYLRVNTATQKASGSGIYIDGTTNSENYTSLIAGVTIRNVPNSVWCTMASFMTIRDNYFAFYSNYGLYVDNDSALFGDNGDNSIYANSFFTNRPSAFSIKYRTGGGRIWGNKINGGLIGLDISPLRPTSVMIVTGNSIENQTLNCIRLFTDTANASAFAMANISDNQINGSSCAGSAIYAASAHLTWNDLTISNNQIRYYLGTTQAVDIRNTSRFKIHGNTLELNGLGQGGFNIDATAINGHLENNTVNNPTGNHTINSSASVTENQLIVRYSTSYDVPSLADGVGTTLAVTAAGAQLGDTVLSSLAIDISSLTMTAYVSAANTVSVRWQNESGGVVDLGAATLKLSVYRQ